MKKLTKVVEKIEWVAVLRGTTGATVQIAYRNARALAVGLEGQTKEGWTVVRVYQRPVKTYSQKHVGAIDK